MFTAKQALSKAFLRLKPERAAIVQFKTEFTRLLDALLRTPGESEEFGKNLLSDFLKNAYYAPDYFINTSDRIDLAIHTGKDSASPVGVIIETKRAGNKAEMPSRENLNAKALQQALWYYLQERIEHRNIEIKHLIITDCREWFIFDAADFERLFFADKTLVKTYQDFADGTLLGRDTAFFYVNIAQPAIEKINGALPYAYFSAADYEAFLRSGTAEYDAQLIALYKLLSPTHLLKLPFANDSNSLDRAFYAELLYLLGLTETEHDHKKVIVRNPPAARQDGSLLENALFHLASRLPLAGEDELFSVALELVITWINRVLFLKLLESQLLAYQNGNAEHAFLSADKIPTYNKLEELFFHALAVEADKRNESVSRAFKNVPYLNSSLFEMSETERQYFPIGQLAERDLALFSSTVLKDSSGRKKTGSMNALGYLFAFLDAYDFASEGTEAIQEERKTLVNASVLGLIFEKINGYKDGSYFTPGSVTAYMCHETITRTALDKFNAAKGWDARTLTDLHNRIGRSAAELAEANAILDSIRVCDPAVGSGHFLVSALNELIALKSGLGVLMDAEGRLLKGYRAEAANDELVLSSDEDGAIFSYKPKSAESRRIQETLFREKRRIIETQLFGVDVNPNSVKICRLRLWIELLKNAYYTKESGYAALETLPNIDINIKCGNSLVSRFACDTDVKRALADTEYTVQGYKDAVQAYRNTRSKKEKAGLERVIADIKARFRQEAELSDPLMRRKQRFEAELSALTKQGALFEPTQKEARETAARVAELSARLAATEADIAELRSGTIYKNAFEWRFEFPEALNDEGDFIGFDIVIGNPPYVRIHEVQNAEKAHYEKQYITASQQFDLYQLFYEKGLKLLCRSSGKLCFITSNKFCVTNYGKKLRELIFDNYDVLQITDVSNVVVFKEASTYPYILLIQNRKTPGNKTSILYLAADDATQCFKRMKEIEQSMLLSGDEKAIMLTQDKNTKLLKKIESNSTRDLLTVYRGRGTASDLEQTQSADSIIAITNKQIGRFVLDGKRFFKNKNTFINDFEPKLLMKKICFSLEVAIDETGEINPINTVYVIKPKNTTLSLKFVLGILCSKLLTYYARTKYLSTHMRGGYIELRVFEIKKLPMPKLDLFKEADKKQHDELVALVGQMLELKRFETIGEDVQKEVAKADKQINTVVYGLYNLTEGEIKAVEGEE